MEKIEKYWEHGKVIKDINLRSTTLLVGDEDWTDSAPIELFLRERVDSASSQEIKKIQLVQFDQAGAQALACKIATDLGMGIQTFPPPKGKQNLLNYHKHIKSMLDQSNRVTRPSYVVIFTKDINKSQYMKMLKEQAEKRDILTEVISG